MLFSAVLMNIPNSKVCLKMEWSIVTPAVKFLITCLNIKEPILQSQQRFLSISEKRNTLKNIPLARYYIFIGIYKNIIVKNAC